MNNKARDEKRDLTDVEQVEFTKLQDDVKRADAEIERIGIVLGLGDQDPPRRGNDGTIDDLVHRCSLFRVIQHQIDSSVDIGAEREWETEQTRDGIRSVKGMLFPLREKRVLNTIQRRALNAATGDAGGYLIDYVLRDDIFIEPLRNRTVTGQLGANILANLVGDQSIPKQSGTITGQWVGENEELTEESPTFSQVRLMPKHVGSYTEATRQAILQGTPAIENIIRTDLETQRNIAIDKAAIQGTGDGAEPMGIMNITGVNTVAFAADTPTWAEVNSISALDEDETLMGSTRFRSRRHDGR